MTDWLTAVDTTRPRVVKSAAPSGRASPVDIPGSRPIKINAPRDWNAEI
jgi:hypothetical protein